MSLFEALPPVLVRRAALLAVIPVVVLAAWAVAESRCGWRRLQPLPQPRWFHAAAVDSEGRVYAIGGLQGLDRVTAVGVALLGWSGRSRTLASVEVLETGP